MFTALIFCLPTRDGGIVMLIMENENENRYGNMEMEMQIKLLA